MAKSVKKPDDDDLDADSILSSEKRAIPHAVHSTGPWGVSHGPIGGFQFNPGGQGGSFTAPMGGTPEDEAARWQLYSALQLYHQEGAAAREYLDICEKEGVERDVAECVFMCAANGFAQARGVRLTDLKQLPVNKKCGDELIAKTTLYQWGSTTSPIHNLIKDIGIRSIALKTASAAWEVGCGVTGTTGLDYKRLAAAAKKLQDKFLLKRMIESAAAAPAPAGTGKGRTPEEAAKMAAEIAAYGEAAMKSWRSDVVSKLLKARDAGEGEEALGMLYAAAGGEVPPWGYLFRHMARPMVRRAIRHSFRHRPTFVGAFRYPHRALIPAMDGRAWHSRLPGLGGTVLLDHSGSMGLSEAQVKELLHKSPLATIAAYSGCNKPLVGGYSSGELAILAKEGRYAAEKVWPRFGGANVVDGPALRWLGKQARPRIWISDGEVTGAHSGGGESAHLALQAECALLCRILGIKRYPSIAAYLASREYRAQFK